MEVAGRGELQLGDSDRNRARGRDFGVVAEGGSRQDSGDLMEPTRRPIDVDEEHTGVVVQKLSERKGEMKETPVGRRAVRPSVFHAPTRGLIGYCASRR
jgi:GTP-binding protein